MIYQSRILSSQLQRGARAFPALLMTGQRCSGKTTFLRHSFPKADQGRARKRMCGQPSTT
ncbi:MAG: hypothetical protein Q8M07_17795 [Prosthecobacter sp.]|nr:hypothetical protein [Prosthecobacter sp.]